MSALTANVARLERIVSRMDAVMGESSSAGVTGATTQPLKCAAARVATTAGRATTACKAGAALRGSRHVGPTTAMTRRPRFAALQQVDIVKKDMTVSKAVGVVLVDNFRVGAANVMTLRPKPAAHRVARAGDAHWERLAATMLRAATCPRPRNAVLEERVPSETAAAERSVVGQVRPVARTGIARLLRRLYQRRRQRGQPARQRGRLVGQ